MSKFDEVVGKSKIAIEPVDVEMTLSCQTCNVQVDTGRYYAAEKILIWVCPEGHKSLMENFSLFG